MLRLSFAVAALCLVAACSSDTVVVPGQGSDGRILVLNTYGQTGITLVADTGASGVHLDLPDSYDGSVFDVRGDTLVTAASKAGGDVLYIASIPNRAVTPVQLPGASNPAGAVFVPAGVQGAGAARYAVALRDSGAIAFVAAASAGTVVSIVRNAGQCPYDVLFAGGLTWSLDSNQDCRGFYASLGPVRLIRVALDGAQRDTIMLGDSVRGASRAYVAGTTAFVFASGDFGARQASVTKVDLGTRAVIKTLRLPAGVYGTAMRLGLDGHLYVTGSGFTPYEPRVYSIETATLAFRGPRVAGGQMLDLRTTTGALARCDAATADAAGLVYCVSNGQVLSRLFVFSLSGIELRSVTTGTLASDIALR